MTCILDTYFKALRPLAALKPTEATLPNTVVRVDRQAIIPPPRDTNIDMMDRIITVTYCQNRDNNVSLSLYDS